MNGSAGNQQQQPLPGPQNGPVFFGSGIVFGGNVYPVLIDGVPIQPPAGAHQAAVQQRLRMQPMQQPAGDHQQSAVHQRIPMQQGRLQGPHPQQSFPKPLPPQRAYQRGPPYGAKPTLPQNPGAFGRVPGGAASSITPMQQPPLYSNLQQQQPQQQQLAAMGGSPGSMNFNYPTQQPSAGGDFHGNWEGFTMWQPADVNQPFVMDWSPF